MKKNLFLLAAAALTFAACSNDEYLGTAPAGVQEGQGGAITFSGLPGNITRAEQSGATAATTLDNKFQVYGVKNVNSSVVNVFSHVTTSAPLDDNKTYNVWWNEPEKDQTTTNKMGWEYVADANFTMPGVNNTTMNGAQTIKYWDYAAASYEFVAYAKTIASPATISDVNLTGFKATGTPDQIAGLYIAEKKTVAKSDFNKVVAFKFRSAAAKVRLGIYETIPGYEVCAIKFYVDATEKGTAATLAGKFPKTESTEMTVSYDATGLPVVKATAFAEMTEFSFGAVTISDVTPMNDTSTNPTWAAGTTIAGNNYTNVFTNTESSNIVPMTLKVDYTLKNDISGETIEVEGATATVPAEYMKWLPNHAYTYLFKISDNTNGSTDGNTVGLYPITFDAYVETTVDATEKGTITTVAEPTITTYQAGSVVTGGVEYKAGTAIDITVVENNAVVTFTADKTVNVYDVTNKANTEADIALLDKANTLGTAVMTEVTSGKKATISAPVADNKYAVVYTDATAAAAKKAYKLIEVAN